MGANPLMPRHAPALREFNERLLARAQNALLEERLDESGDGNRYCGAKPFDGGPIAVF